MQNINAKLNLRHKKMDKAEIYEKASKILMTWSKEDLIADILELTTFEGLEEFVEQNEILCN